MHQWRKTAAALLAATMAACGGGGGGGGAPVTPQKASEDTLKYSVDVVKPVTSALAAVQGMSSLQALLQQLEPLLAQLGLSTGLAPSTSGLSLRLAGAGRALAGPRADLETLASVGAQPRRGAVARAIAFLQGDDDPAEVAAADLEAFLRDRVFAESNVETSDAGGVTYLLRGALLCAEPGDDSLDEECVSEFDQLQVRIRVTPRGGGVDLAFQLTSARHQPLVLKLGETSVALESDLAAVKATLDALGADPSEVPKALSGVVEAKLDVTSEQAFTASVKVLRAIDLQVEDEQGLHVGTLAACEPLRVAVDGVAQSISADVSFGAFSFNEPFMAWQNGGWVSVGAHAVTAAGATGGVVLRGDGSVSLRNLSLAGGPLRETLDGQTVTSLSVARPFGVDVTQAGQSTTASLTAAADVELILRWSALAPYEQRAFDPYTGQLDPTVDDDQYAFHLDGSVTHLEYACDPWGCGETVRLDAGSLRVTASGGGASSEYVGAVGMCSYDDGPPAGGHPLLDGTYTAACP